jgi:hypothetical protein
VRWRGQAQREALWSAIADVRQGLDGGGGGGGGAAAVLAEVSHAMKADPAQNISAVEAPRVILGSR